MNTRTQRTDQPSHERRGFLRRSVGILASMAFTSSFLRERVFAQAGETAKPVNKPQSIEESEPYLGQIAIMAFGFAPKGWLKCDGSLLSIQQNNALFALLGTTYGGNGTTTFALPDFRGRVPVGYGSNILGRTVDLGESGGETTHTLALGEMPVHAHTLAVNAGPGNSSNPAGAYPAASPEGTKQFSSTPTTFAPDQSIGATGSSTPHNNMQPYLALTVIIATQGIFPSRP